MHRLVNDFETFDKSTIGDGDQHHGGPGAGARAGAGAGAGAGEGRGSGGSFEGEVPSTIYDVEEFKIQVSGIRWATIDWVGCLLPNDFRNSLPSHLTT